MKEKSFTIEQFKEAYQKATVSKAAESFKQKNGDITEDDLRGLEKEVQKLTDESIKEVDKIASDKEQELLDV